MPIRKYARDDKMSWIGIQALDVGHVDIEYCWFKMGVTEKVAVPGKYTNEVENGRIVSEISDGGQYISQVIARIE